MGAAKTEQLETVNKKSALLHVPNRFLKD